MNETTAVPDFATLMEDPAALKERLIAQVRAARGSQAFDSKALLQNLVKQTVEAFLEVEMEDHLGYPKYVPEGRGNGNSRNGTTPFSLRTATRRPSTNTTGQTRSSGRQVGGS